MEDIDSYMSIIDEMIEDENKIITYKMLSQHLALPVNKSRKILEHYNKNSEASSLNTIYFLTGRYKSKIIISIVPGSKLNLKKSRLDSVISSHIYSIQKADIQDPSTLYNVDYEMTKTASYKYASFAMIKYNGSKQLSNAEIKSLQCSTKQNGTEPEQTISNKVNTTCLTQKKQSAKPVKSFFSQKPSNKENIESQQKEVKNDGNSSKSNLPSRTSGEVSIADTKPTNQKASPSGATGMKMFMTKGKMDLFKTKPNKTSSAVVDSKTTSDVENKQVDISLNDSELLALSEKMDVDDFDSTNETRNSKVDKTSSNLLMDVDHQDLESTNQEELNKSQTSVNKNKQTKSKSLSRKKSNASHSNGTSKKRKRIKEVFSSSSSESEEEEFLDDSNIIPPSPPVKAPVLAPKNPRKKRILKSRTYVDDEGAMLTEKVWEEVSCSSEEEKEEVKVEKKSPEINNPVSLKQPSSAKQKQATLFGFFNKKT